MFNKFGLLVGVLAVFFCEKSNGDESVSPASPLQSSDELATQTFVVFYYGVNESDRYPITELYRLLENPNFDSCKISAFYAHGNAGSQTNPRTRAIVWAYRKRQHSHNCLSLDWKDPSYADGNYSIAVYNSAVIGELIANIFLDLLNDGKLSQLQLSKFHLFGGSMGAQLFGVTGRTLIKISKKAYKFTRITGLDPANMGFPPSLSRLLSGRDAKFVDIIHTAMGVRGSSTTGTADFYPNGGVTTQPGCKFVALNENDLCSHQRAVYYWAESVASENGGDFFAAAPRTWFSSDEEEIVRMGIDCPMTARGKYYLQTNSSAPYALGMNGVHYDPSIWNIKDPNKC